MKSLKECILEGILDIEDNINYDIKEDVIEQFLKDNYDIRGPHTIKETKDGFIVDVKGQVEVKNRDITSLTNGLFEFGKVEKGFNCSECRLLTSLEGSPKEVGWSFNCSYCKSLKTLEGAPKEVGETFYCNNCKSLKSLKGAPQECYSFYCNDCGVKFNTEDVKKYTKVDGVIGV